MAVPTMIESSRTHTAAGAFGSIGGAISAATNATPIVITTTSAHGLKDGDQVQVTGITTNTNANTTAFAKVTGFSTTTFGMYSDAALTTGVAGNGTSGLSAASIVSQAFDISSFTTQDWTLKLRIEGLTANKKCVVSFQDSVDGFVADVVTRMLVAVQGAVNPSPTLTFASKDYTNRKYDTPGTRFGVTNARLRVNVNQIDAATTLVLTAWYEIG